MKDVVRKKLGLATSVPIYLSELRKGGSLDPEDGTLLDLEDGTFATQMDYLYSLLNFFFLHR
jgi:hypothetical protein